MIDGGFGNSVLEKIGLCRLSNIGNDCDLHTRSNVSLHCRWPTALIHLSDDRLANWNYLNGIGTLFIVVRVLVSRLAGGDDVSILGSKALGNQRVSDIILELKTKELGLAVPEARVPNGVTTGKREAAWGGLLTMVDKCLEQSRRG